MWHCSNIIVNYDKHPKQERGGAQSHATDDKAVSSLIDETER